MCWDGDAPDFYVESTGTARKSHVCEECCQEVRVGQRFAKVVGKWDGEIGSYYWHPECYDLYVRLARALCDGSMAFGDVPEHLEYVRDYQAALESHGLSVEDVLGRWEWIQQKYSGREYDHGEAGA